MDFVLIITELLQCERRLQV